MTIKNTVHVPDYDSVGINPDTVVSPSPETLIYNEMMQGKIRALLKGRNDTGKPFVTGSTLLKHMPGQLTNALILRRANACAEVFLDTEVGDLDFFNVWAKSQVLPKELLEKPVSPTNPKKENTMKVSDAQILVQLAQADVNDEFTENMQSMPAALREAIEDQRKQESKEAMQKAAKLILQVYKDSEEAVRTQVQNIRNARTMEQQSKERIAKIERAKAYAEATNNYLPLASLVGGLDVGASVDKSKRSIPEDWVAPEEKEANPAPAKKVVAKK